MGRLSSFLTFLLLLCSVGPDKERSHLGGTRRPTKVWARHFIIPFLFLISILGSSASHADAGARAGYVGTVTKSDRHKTGQQFTFANLLSQRPFVTFPSGYGNETTKFFEDDEITVLVFVAQFTGSTETFYLNKKRDRFMLIEVGALEATASGKNFRPDVTSGTLK